MDGWQQDWWKMLDTITKELEQLFREVAQDVEDTAEALFELSETWVDQLEEAIAPGLDQLDEQFGEWLEPALDALFGLESAIDRAAEPLTHTVEPILNAHPVCIGCRHYHGHIYGGELLVCAMHPYGMDEGVETCPDKELISW